MEVKNINNITFGNIIIKDGAKKIIDKRLHQRYQTKLDTIIKDNADPDTDVVFDRYRPYSNKLYAYFIKHEENSKPISYGKESCISANYRNPLSFIQKAISESKNIK